jgi:hypothetical protein
MRGEADMAETPDPIPSPTPGQRVAWNPALVIGTIATIISAVMAAWQASAAVGMNPVVSVALAVLPLLTGLGIRPSVLSKAWVRDLIKVADTTLEVVRPLAAETSAPPETVPTAH